MSKGNHILLIEDNKLDIELTMEAFQDAKFETGVYVAETGQKALDYLMGRGEYQDRQKYPLPDLILLDLKLPGITGHEVLAQIKNTPGIKRIPTIALTSSREMKDVTQCYDSGVNSYIVKPVSFEGFLEVILQIEKYWFQRNIPAPTLEKSDLY